MNIIYTSALPDKHAYKTLFSTTGWNSIYKATDNDLFNSLQNSWYSMFGYNGNSLIGCGRLISDGVMYALVCDIIVHPDYQRKGIGSLLLRTLIKKCKETGIRQIWLFAAKGKEEFYLKNGFFKRPGDAPGMYYKYVD